MKRSPVTVTSVIPKGDLVKKLNLNKKAKVFPVAYLSLGSRNLNRNLRKGK